MAASEGVPPYVVFGDRTLRALAKAKPTELGALLEVPGIGAATSQKYGESVLAVLNGDSSRQWQRTDSNATTSSLCKGEHLSRFSRHHSSSRRVCLVDQIHTLSPPARKIPNFYPPILFWLEC